MTASSSLSYLGLKVTVKAQSIILPARQKSQTEQKVEQAETLCRSLIRILQTINVGAKVDLADIVVLEHCGVAGVGCVVSSTVVEGAAGRKSKASIQPILFN